jgi:hypothetical protein
MSSGKSIFIKSFNNLFFKLFEEVLELFPDNQEILKGKIACETLKSMNITSLIKGWKLYITSKYKTEIQDGNFDFFMKHNYEEDVSGNQELLKMIQQLREPIESMNEDQRNSCFLKIQQLTQWSEIY